MLLNVFSLGDILLDQTIVPERTQRYRHNGRFRSPARRRRPWSSFRESHRRPSNRHRSRSPRRFSRSVRDESDLIGDHQKVILTHSLTWTYVPTSSWINTMVTQTRHSRDTSERSYSESDTTKWSSMGYVYLQMEGLSVLRFSEHVLMLWWPPPFSKESTKKEMK